MIRLNNFISKIGVDKVLHYAFGGWSVSIVSSFGTYAMVIMLIIILLLSLIKERYFDESFDLYDIVATLFGCFTSFVLYTPITMLAKYLLNT